MVADGFAGNVLLKGLEGAGAALFTQLRAAADSSLRAKLGGLLLRPAVRAIRTKIDPETYGGAYLLGVRGVVVDRARQLSRVAIRNAITYTAKGVAAGVVERLGARVAPPRARRRHSGLADGRRATYSPARRGHGEWRRVTDES